MTNQPIDVSNLVARESIRDCLMRYCRAIDRRDAVLLRSCYWPGAKDDHSIYIGPVEGFIDFAIAKLASMTLTQHNLGHSLIEVRGGMAVGETHVTAYHRINIEGKDRDVLLSARYLDRFERRGQEWRIADRVLVNDWVRDLGESVDWSKGLLGAPLVSDYAIGLSRGDYSEILFKRLDSSKVS